MNRFLLAVSVVAAAALLQGCNAECSSLRDEAAALREEAEVCAPGDSCILVNMYEMAGENNCLLAFQCDHALNATTDLNAFETRARAIAGDFRDCNECVMADCFGSDSLVPRCDEATGRCVVDIVEPTNG